MAGFVSAGTQFILHFENASSSDSTGGGPGTATSRITFNADGTVSELNAAGFTLVELGDPTDLEVFVTGTGDTLTGDPVDTWINLGDAPAFTLAIASPASGSFSGTYAIRDANTLVQLGSASFTLVSDAAP